MQRLLAAGLVTALVACGVPLDEEQPVSTPIPTLTPTSSPSPTPMATATPIAMPTPTQLHTPTSTPWCPPDWEEYYFTLLPLQEAVDVHWLAIIDQFMRLEDDPSILHSGDWQQETLAHVEELEESVQALYGLAAVASDALREVDVLNQAHAKALLEGVADLTLWIEEELEPGVAVEAYEAEGKHPLIVFSGFFPQESETGAAFHYALWEHLSLLGRGHDVDCGLVLVDGKMVRPTHSSSGS